MAWQLFAGELQVNSACCAHRSLSSVNICWQFSNTAGKDWWRPMGTAREIAIEVVKFQPGKTTCLTARSRDTLWCPVLISPFRRLQTELFPCNEMRRCKTTGMRLVKFGATEVCHGSTWIGEAKPAPPASAILIMAIPSLNTPSRPASEWEQQWTRMK
jgi:hypothetical protein